MKNSRLHITKDCPTILKAGFVLFAFALVASHTGTAAVAIFQNGRGHPFGSGAYTNCQDTMLSGISTDQNFGKRPTFNVGEYATQPNYRYRSLIRFDVTSLATNARSIDAVTLRLFVTASGERGTGDTIQAFRVAPTNANWIEGSGAGVAGNDPPDVGMSTWAMRIEGSVAWAGSAGLSSPGVDYITNLVASFQYAPDEVTTGTPVDLEFTNDVSFLSDWVAGSNAGLLLRTARQLDSALTFASSDSDPDTFDWRPQLIVHYTPLNPQTNVLTIRCSQVELCWVSTSNTQYQVQYRSDLTTNIWTDLGGPVLGTGSTICIYDPVLPAQPQRFYQFITLTNQ